MDSRQYEAKFRKRATVMFVVAFISMLATIAMLCVSLVVSAMFWIPTIFLGIATAFSYILHEYCESKWESAYTLRTGHIIIHI